jgi:hypothetical protein
MATVDALEVTARRWAAFSDRRIGLSAGVVDMALLEAKAARGVYAWLGTEIEHPSIGIVLAI